MSQFKIGLIGGTGIGQLLAGTPTTQRHEIDTPFGRPSDAILESEIQGIPVLLLGRHGPGHVIPPSQIPFRANIFALKKLGCTHIIATGAVGSLRQEMKPKDLVVPDQIIDRTTGRIGTFFDKAAVHVEFAEPFCPILRQILIEPGVHDRGCYVCVEGPNFCTRAESLMHRLWGGDLAGMTVMPEAKLAREAELPYALVALVTDYDCWRPKDPKAPPSNPDAESLLKEIMGNLQEASAGAMALISRALGRIAAKPESIANCPASQALKLAIWSDKSRIDPEEINRLSTLWGKYFG
jgi:5'-methylthioadenosine phosphorylase